MHKENIVLCELSDNTFDPAASYSDVNTYRVRKAARGVLLHHDTMALIHITKKNYHKLPGGGIEAGESNSDGFKRELLEETGCHGEILSEGPITIEYRDQFKLVQLSYIFIAKVVGKVGQVQFEQDELDEGSELVWVPKHTAVSLLENENPSEYEAQFINRRDSEILKYWRRVQTI